MEGLKKIEENSIKVGDCYKHWTMSLNILFFFKVTLKLRETIIYNA